MLQNPAHVAAHLVQNKQLFSIFQAIFQSKRGKFFQNLKDSISTYNQILDTIYDN